MTNLCEGDLCLIRNIFNRPAITQSVYRFDLKLITVIIIGYDEATLDLAKIICFNAGKGLGKCYVVLLDRVYKRQGLILIRSNGILIAAAVSRAVNRSIISRIGLCNHKYRAIC